MSVILFVIILVALIVGHEFGHFSVAKWVRMKVLEFGLGFPPKLWGKKIGDTEYSVNAIPFGGFVKIYGEDATEVTTNEAFGKHPKAAQAAVLFAGPFMNVVLGFIAFFIAYSVGVPAVVDGSHPDARITNPRVVITELLPGSPAAKAGLKVGDQVLSLAHGSLVSPVVDSEDVLNSIKNDHSPLTITIKRGGAEQALSMTPVTGIITEFPDRYAVGIASMKLGTMSLSVPSAFVEAATQTWQGLYGVAAGLVTMVAGLFTLSGSLADVSGPVGIAQLVGDASIFGLGQVLVLTAIISLNLAVLNLLPFPALDGGRLAMLLYESVRGKAIHQNTAAIVNTVGFAILVILMLVVTYHDIAKLFG